MFKNSFRTVLVLAVIAVSILAGYPAVRNASLRTFRDATGWDDEARQQDPVGFLNHVQAKLKNDLELMRKSRRELAAEVAQLSTVRRRQEAQAEQSRHLAAEFRDAYRDALANDSFPIEVRGQAYTQAQVRAQIGLLLALAESHEASLAEVMSIQSDAEQRMEDLALRISRTESQFALLATKRHLLRVRELSREGEALLAQVDELMSGNAQAIAAYPVRTPEELLPGKPARPAGRVNDREIEQFLTRIPLGENVTRDEAVRPAAAFGPAEQSGSAIPRTIGKPASKPTAKPIFQQS